MHGQDFLRALLVVAGVYSIGQGLVWIPAALELNDVLTSGPTEGWLLLGRVSLPILYGALLVVLSGSASRLLMSSATTAPPSGIAGFAESLIGVAGILLVGLALVDLASLSFQLTVLDARQEMLNEPRAPYAVGPWLQPFGRLVLGVILVASRGSAARLVASRR